MRVLHTLQYREYYPPCERLANVAATPAGPGCLLNTTADARPEVDAAGRTLTGNFNGGGTANAVYNSVAAGRPTCIALPVFTSVSPLGGNNWTSLSGQTGGRVLDPPPGSIANEAMPSASPASRPTPVNRQAATSSSATVGVTPDGACAANPADPRNPERGYGSVSATYVDKFAWQWRNL